MERVVTQDRHANELLNRRQDSLEGKRFCQMSLPEYAKVSAGPNSYFSFVSPRDTIVTQDVTSNNSFRFNAQALARFEANLERLPYSKKAGFIDSWYAALKQAIQTSSLCRGAVVSERFGKSQFVGDDFLTSPMLPEDFLEKALVLLNSHGFPHHAARLVTRLSAAQNAARRSIELKFSSTRDYEGQIELVRNITDQAFLKRLVQMSVGTAFGGTTPESEAVKKVTDQQWLQSVADCNRYDSFIRKNAAQSISDLTILENMIKDGVENLSRISRISHYSHDGFDDNKILIETMENYLDRVSEDGSAVNTELMYLIIGYKHLISGCWRTAIDLLKKENRLPKLLVDLEDQQTPIYRSLRSSSWHNHYSDVTFHVKCQLHEMQTGEKFDIPFSELVRLENTTEQDSCDAVYSYKLETIVSAVQKRRWGLSLSKLQESFLKDALKDAQILYDRFQGQMNAGLELNEYQKAWLKTYNLAIKAYEELSQRP